MVEVVVGRIGRPHGVRGEVTVEVRTDSPEERFAAGAVLTPDPAGPAPLVVDAARWHGGRLLVGFAGVTDRTSAERLRGLRLVVDVPAGQQPEDPEEFYDHQLVGLRAETVDGAEVGTVTEVLHLPGQELLAVRRADGRETLVPFVAEIVPEVDVAGGRLLLDPPAGLLDESDHPAAPPARPRSSGSPRHPREPHAR